MVLQLYVHRKRTALVIIDYSKQGSPACQYGYHLHIRLNQPVPCGAPLSYEFTLCWAAVHMDCFVAHT